MARTFYSFAEDAKIRKLISEGWYSVDIAREIGRTQGAVKRYCFRNGIKMMPNTCPPGPRGPNWKRGYTIDKDGYKLSRSKDHPRARRGYVFEHRLVMEKHLGRYLLPDEVVHHKDGDNSNNSLDNLELFATNAEHLHCELAGKCPQWSDEGKRNISASTRRMNHDRAEKKRHLATLLALKTDDQQTQ